MICMKTVLLCAKNVIMYIGIKLKEDYIQAFPKPGNKRKEKINNRKTRLHDFKKPDELICDFCDTISKTCCFRHPEDDNIKFLDGGGIMGGKVNDNLAVLGCYDCDKKYSTKPDRDASELEKALHSLAWAKAIIKRNCLGGKNE